MNGINPREQASPRVRQSVALQRGTDEILSVIRAESRRLADLACKATVKAVAEVQTDDTADIDLKTQLEEVLRKLGDAQGQIEELAADLEAKDATIKRLNEKLDLKDQELKVLQKTSARQPNSDEDVEMSAATSTLQGEHDQFLDDTALSGDFVHVDGNLLQLDNMSTLLPDLFFDGDEQYTPAVRQLSSHQVVVAISPQDRDTERSDNSESESHSDWQSDMDVVMEVAQDWHLSQNDPESDTEYFPYPPGATPAVRLKKPTHSVTAAPHKLPQFQILASPLRPEEQLVDLVVDEESESGSDGSED